MSRCTSLVGRSVNDDDDGIESDDLERREDGQLDGPCVQRWFIVQADVTMICQHCRAPFARLCALHVLKAGSSARDQLQA